MPLLLRKLRIRDTASAPTSCHWDETSRVVTLTYDADSAEPRIVELSLPVDAVQRFADGSLDQDVRDVWGGQVGTIEGAARFATVFLDECVRTSADDPLRLELTPIGIRRRRP